MGAISMPELGALVLLTGKVNDEDRESGTGNQERRIHRHPPNKPQKESVYVEQFDADRRVDACLDNFQATFDKMVMTITAKHSSTIKNLPFITKIIMELLLLPKFKMS